MDVAAVVIGMDEEKRLEGLEEEELEEEEDLEEKYLNELMDEVCLSFCPCQSPVDPPPPPVCANSRTLARPHKITYACSFY